VDATHFELYSDGLGTTWQFISIKLGPHLLEFTGNVNMVDTSTYLMGLYINQHHLVGRIAIFGAKKKSRHSFPELLDAYSSSIPQAI
jgi:hypothetical protein